ncbi:MAG: hypothetical protein IPO78_17180 [Saprospiraceae bacterium]|nr:hypothetical protein [Saprospiraceae bacterium]
MKTETTVTKCCARCKKELDSNRKTYCSYSCRYWFHMIEKEKGLPPKKKRNKDWFYMITGSEVAKMKGAQRQGRRSGGMIVGGMSARVECTTEKLVPFTVENIIKHFNGIPTYKPTHLRFGDNSRISKEASFRELT